MLFSSTPFFVFFAVYLVGHLLLPLKYRTTLILVGSTIFYAYWKIDYVWVPYALILIALVGGQLIDGATRQKVRRARLACTIVLLLMPLGYFKYFDFFYLSVVGPLLGTQNKIVELPLPLGISFITFTLISYVVEVYRKQFPAERSLTRLSAFILFFPQLIAGPILRPKELIPQLEKPQRVLASQFTLGMIIFTVGLVKKLVFADQIGVAVDGVYTGGGHDLYMTDYLLAIYGFSLQIYCDFSGYTDMAIGLGVMLRIKLPNNFQCPYNAASVAEFWKRWHITLSTWLRDHLYIPLGGNRHGLKIQIASVFITMALGGLWHGASWTFVIWGALQGVAIAAYHLWRAKGWSFSKVPRWLLTVLTFHVITFLWVFFRAPDLATVARVVTGPFVNSTGNVAEFVTGHRFELILLLVFFASHRFDDHRLFRRLARKAPVAVTWGGIAVLWMVALTISGTSSAQFIYFDF